MKIRAVVPEMTEKTVKNKSIDRTLLELIAGMLPYGLICEAAGAFFVKRIGYYSLGLGLGILTAMAMAWHMWYSLDRAFELNQDGAAKYLTTRNLLRYAAVAVVLGVIMAFDFANPIAAFIGIMGLKVSAYLQPLTHKCFKKLFGWEDVFADPMPEEDPGETEDGHL